MHDLTERLRDLFRLHPGWFALAAALALAAVGVTAMQENHADYAAAQTRWIVIGLVVMVFVVLPHPRWIGHWSFPLIAVTIGLLAFVVLPGVPRSLVPVRNGTTSWINFYFMMFQPSELAKIVFVLALAWYLRHRESYRTLRGLLIPFVIMFVPVVLILKEPDLGTAVLFPPALFAVLLAAGARLRHLGTLVGLGVLALTLNVVAIYTLPDSFQVLKPHQRLRIQAMISQMQGDTRYADNVGYQQDKAMTLIGSGRVSGYGAARSAEIVRFNRVPEDHNDMIYCVIVNRWGFVGGAGVLGLYGLMIVSLLAAAERSKDPFARLAIVGFAGLLMTQVAINVGMNIGLLPIIGITLPFVSYGGSSLVTAFIMVGLVLNFASRRPAIVNRPTFEFDRADALA
jgi:rod shape determining protein RodA